VKITDYRGETPAGLWLKQPRSRLREAWWGEELTREALRRPGPRSRGRGAGRASPLPFPWKEKAGGAVTVPAAVPESAAHSEVLLVAQASLRACKE